MHAAGSKAEVLTNVFGGSLSNEWLGILNFSFEWQYVSDFCSERYRALKSSGTIDHILRDVFAFGTAGELSIFGHPS